MSANNSQFLKNSRKAKKDEFYTRMTDIEAEMKFHEKSFFNKIVYLNVDDEKSNFWIYFVSNFERLRYDRVIATCYNENGHGICHIYDGKFHYRSRLLGDGDFRSDECVAILRNCDVIVTNPPFSIAREWLDLVIQNGKEFIMLGTLLMASCKQPFEYFKDGLCWFGQSICSGDRKFNVPDDYYLDTKGGGRDHLGKFIKVKGVRWITNMDFVDKEPLQTDVIYNPDIHQNYDDYEAINVDKVGMIPMDYDGCMGVPVTILDKLCSRQFELVDLIVPSLNGKPKFKRIVIRRKRTDV